MTLKVDTITNVAGTGAPNATDGVTVGGAALSSVNQMEYTSSANPPDNPANGAVWWSTGDEQMFLYVNDAWYELASTPPPPAFLGDRGVFAEGVDASGNNPGLMDYVTISTTGNATNFGQLSLRNEFSEMGGCFGLSGDGSSRGVFAGGTLNGLSGSSYQTNDIEYITFATTGNGTTFGDLTQARYSGASVSSGTRGCFIGGASITTAQNIIDYITIATTGNATDFGDTSTATRFNAGVSSETRGVYGGVSSNGTGTLLEYITIATTGNATQFGFLTVGNRARLAACSDGSRGVFAGGDSSSTATSNVIDYITIDTTGNATDFGDLNVATDEHAACANTTRGLFGGGHTSVYTNAISYITIQTTGNSADFGDLTVARYGLTAASGA